MKKEYSAVRTCRQYNVKDGTAKITVTGDKGIVEDIDGILKKYLDGWWKVNGYSGEIDSISLVDESRYYVDKCPSNETCWKYVVRDRHLKNISVAVFGVENQAKKYCDYLNRN